MAGLLGVLKTLLADIPVLKPAPVQIPRQPTVELIVLASMVAMLQERTQMHNAYQPLPVLCQQIPYPMAVIQELS